MMFLAFESLHMLFHLPGTLPGELLLGLPGELLLRLQESVQARPHPSLNIFLF